jgi:putative aldouronate transport system permease protein
VLQGVNVFNLIVTRIFFVTTIPEPLYEAARIDGSSELRSFFTIALPLAAPIIAVMALFYGVTRWNDYMTALIYLSDNELFPLQLILRGILIQNQNALATIDQMDASTVKAAVNIAYMAEAMKYSLIFIASAPLLVVYPFVQKYFVKGVMIGSLKG